MKNKIIALARKDVFVIGMSISLAFVLFVPWNLLVSKFAGSSYLSYEFFNNFLLFVFFYILLKRHAHNKNIYILVLWGIVFGYFSSFLAVNISTIFMPRGFYRLLQSIESLDRVLFQLSIPIWTLSWLYGAVAGLFIGLSRKGRSDRADQGVRVVENDVK